MKIIYPRYGKPYFERVVTGKTYKPNGARECARRRKQLRNGTLQLG